MPNEQVEKSDGARLMMLRLPGGWAMVTNHFSDVDSIVEQGQIVNHEYYYEDLLVLEQVGYDREPQNVSSFHGGYVVDLGWRPSGDLDGAFHLTVLRENGNHVVAEFSAENRHTIPATIGELCRLIGKRLPDNSIGFLTRTKMRRLQPTLPEE